MENAAVVLYFIDFVLHVIYLKAFASVRLLIDLYLLESNI
jgi:hypothetical protein